MDGSWKLKTCRKDAHTAENAYCTLVARSGLLGGGSNSAYTTSEKLLENGDTAPGFNLDYETM